MNRNVREGRFVGMVYGKPVRRRAHVPPVTIGNNVLFPACTPYVSSDIAWITLRERTGQLPQHLRPRYLSKAVRAALAA